MLKTTILGFGTAAALSLAAAVTPAFANYGGCTENPEGKGCPGAPHASARRCVHELVATHEACPLL